MPTNKYARKGKGRTREKEARVIGARASISTRLVVYWKKKTKNHDGLSYNWKQVENFSIFLFLGWISYTSGSRKKKVYYEADGAAGKRVRDCGLVGTCYAPVTVTNELELTNPRPKPRCLGVTPFGVDKRSFGPSCGWLPETAEGPSEARVFPVCRRSIIYTRRTRSFAWGPITMFLFVFFSTSEFFQLVERFASVFNEQTFSKTH